MFPQLGSSIVRREMVSADLNVAEDAVAGDGLHAEALFASGYECDHDHASHLPSATITYSDAAFARLLNDSTASMMMRSPALWSPADELSVGIDQTRETNRLSSGRRDVASHDAALESLMGEWSETSRSAKRSVNSGAGRRGPGSLSVKLEDATNRDSSEVDGANAD